MKHPVLPDTDQANILLVDDRPENIFVLEEILAGTDCRLLSAHCGQEALSKILKHEIALVLLDVQMPDISGFEVAELIRGKQRFLHIPIIFITAINKDPVHIFQGYEAGAVDYLFKPLDPAILRSKVNVFIELHRQKKLLENQARELERRMQDLEQEVQLRNRVEQQLREYQSSLKEIVKERTAELQAVNQQLQIELAEEQRMEQQLRNIMEGIILAMARTAEIRDPYTAGHQRRVSQLATTIAQEMGLPREQIEGIRLAGLVHDLGKIYVPAEILSKPGRLNEIEFSLIKSHPLLGHDILKTIDFPWPIADITLQHQERLDGSGYPKGLTRSEILLETKIISVADVVEAMTFHRPYRPALGEERAMTEIISHKGLLYDPDVVDVCITLLREKKFLFENT